MRVVSSPTRNTKSISGNSGGEGPVDEIIKAQRKEIAQMEWLSEDTENKGEATT